MGDSMGWRTSVGFTSLAIILLAACSPASEDNPFSVFSPPDQAVAGGEVTAPLDEPELVLPMKFQRLGVDDGLSQSSVYAIIQDPAGFIWFGTWNGLNRYDGYSFKIFRNDPANPASLSSNIIRVLYVDRLGQLWVGTDQGLNLYHPESGGFTRYQHDPDDGTSLSGDQISSIVEDSQGRLWIGTTGGGLNRFERETGQFSRYLNNPRNPNSLADNHITALAESDDGSLWIGTWNGLDQLPAGGNQFIHYRHDPADAASLSSDLIQSLAVDDENHLWVGTANGLDEYSPSDGKFTHQSSPPGEPGNLPGERVLELFKDRHGDVWIGTDNGLARVQPRSRRFFQYTYRTGDPDNPLSLSHPVVTAVFQDRSGVIWIGTEGGGVNYFSPAVRVFQHYSTLSGRERGLSDQMTWAFARSQDGDLWVATSRGISRLPAGGQDFIYYGADSGPVDEPPSDEIWSLLITSDGTLWAGGARGLSRYDPQADAFRLIYRPEARLFSSDLAEQEGPPVSVMLEDLDGNLICGTRGYGLWTLDEDRQMLVPYQFNGRDVSELKRAVITSLWLDQNGMLWIGTLPNSSQAGGLFRLNRRLGILTQYLNYPSDPHSLSSNQVLSVYRDSRGFLWVGTTGGLNRLEAGTNRFIHYRQEDGLPNDVIYAIQEDDRGALWVSTNLGLARMEVNSADFDTFNSKDGLQSNEFNSGAAYRDVDGRLYFGGIQGFNVFNPDQVHKNPYIPPVVITSITQGGAPLHLETPADQVEVLELQWPRNYFEFEFAGLNYIHAEENRYAYRLDPFDQDWIDAGHQRNGRYTNLPGGEYTLRIRAANNDGIWNLQGASIRVVVKPPLWEVGWFRWGMAGLVIGGLFGGYRLRVRGIHARNEQLERQVEERTREIIQRQQVAEGLRDILERINANEPLDESLKLIIQQIPKLTTAKAAFLFEIRPQSNRMVAVEPAADDDRDGLSFAGKDELLCWCADLISDQLPHAIRDLPDALQQQQINPCPFLMGLQVLWVFPVFPTERLFGGLAVAFAERRPLQTEERGLLNSFVDQVSLAIGNAQLRQKAEELAVLGERNRLARDLHDAVTQTLFSASLIAEALPEVWKTDKDEGRRMLGELRQLSRGALAEMRSLLMELRPAALEDARLEDLLRQLGEAAAGRSGMRVEVKIRTEIALPREVRIGFYRIAQEGLNNAVRHSRASEINLELDVQLKRDSRIEAILRLVDNGVGYDTRPAGQHFGLNNMEERAKTINADLTINSKPGNGTRITLFWCGIGAEDEQ